MRLSGNGNEQQIYGEKANGHNSMDQTSWGKFARLCVEVDLTKPLLGVYMINGKLYQIEYEGIHQICFLCGKIDYEQKQCTIEKEIDSERGQHLQVRDENYKETSMHQAEGHNTHRMDAKEEEARRKEKGKETIQHTSNNFGPWMIVQKQRSRRETKEEGNKNGEGTSKAVEKEKKNENSSRFKVLEVEETQQEEEELQQKEEERDTNKQTTHKASPQKNKGKNQMQQNQKKPKENNNGTFTQNLPKQTAQSKGKAIGSHKAIKITQEKTTSHNQEGLIEETHRENWNETNDDTQSTELEEIQCTELNKNFMEEGRPLDPEKSDRNQEDSMETEM
ncbi:uncharacterized protein LOC130980633 [Arachis stenosperma]|uniref:uncharacterized protein LOC130980633 n=1 Tax=Arachis stenosperma TaxID=217475 RepID=UPI0025ABAC8B|nr:uncharacterized protein LOC130980633 [Arachis stenosperma]